MRFALTLASAGILARVGGDDGEQPVLREQPGQLEDKKHHTAEARPVALAETEGHREPTDRAIRSWGPPQDPNAVIPAGKTPAFQKDKGNKSGGPGARTKDTEAAGGSSWEYYLTGTGLILWLGPLLILTMIAVVTMGGKYYRNHNRAQARRLREERILACPTADSIRDTHRKTAASSTFTPQQETAFSDRSVPNLCTLLEDMTPLGDAPVELHPWAAKPKTVGALAGMHVASLAGEDPYGYAAEVHAAGALAKFVAFLDGTDDRRHCALIVLALIAYNDVCADALVKMRVQDKLLNYKAKGPYESTTVTIILRYLFFYSEEAKHDFLEKKQGLALFTGLLGDGAPELQLTALTNLLDLLFGAEGLDAKVLVMLQAERTTLFPILDAMAKATDEDVVENAVYLKETLADTSLLMESSPA